MSRKLVVLKIGGEVIETRSELSALVQSLASLMSSGFDPVLVHGAGPQMNRALEQNGLEPTYVQGNRVTNAETLSIAKRVFLKANSCLVDALSEASIPHRPITNGVFQAQVRDLDTFGFVGHVTAVDDESIQAALTHGQVPVLSCMGESESGQLLNINADVAARQLAMQLKPHKTIFVTAKGGWIENGKKLKSIHMDSDYDAMAEQDYTGRQGTLLKLNEIKLLLDSLPSSASVVLTSAEAVAREVADHASDGTVCVKSALQRPVLWNSHKRYKVGLLGARGYVGREVIRLIGSHPEFELVCASSRALKGQSVLDMALKCPLNPHTQYPILSPDVVDSSTLQIDPNLVFSSLSAQDLDTFSLVDDIDVWILALPNGHSEEYVGALRARSKSCVVLDLSADQRFNDEWVYGLPELPNGREKLCGAKLISNPGCYATAAQLGLCPVISQMTLVPHIFGVSGYSGAGTGPSTNNDESFLADNLAAYKPVGHIHEQEITRHLQHPVSFMPHVAPYFRGIHLTISAFMRENVPESRIQEIFEAYHDRNRLVRVQKEIPYVRDNASRHHVTLGGFSVDPEANRLVLYATIDNLLKGAATQAIQNLNLALDLPEYSGM